MPAERNFEMANRRKLFVSDSVRTVAAGLAAFIAVGVVVFGVLYGVVYLWSMSNVWADLLYMYTGPIAIAVGLVSAGYVVAKIAHRAPFIHSASLVALLALVHAAYRRWGPETLSDDLVPAIVSTFGPHITTRETLLIEIFLVETVLVCLPFAMLGTWIGLRKRRGRESKETKNI